MPGLTPAGGVQERLGPRPALNRSPRGARWVSVEPLRLDRLALGMSTLLAGKGTSGFFVSWIRAQLIEPEALTPRHPPRPLGVPEKIREDNCGELDGPRFLSPAARHAHAESGNYWLVLLGLQHGRRRDEVRPTSWRHRQDRCVPGGRVPTTTDRLHHDAG